MHDIAEIKFRNEQFAANTKARRCLESGRINMDHVAIPDHVRDEIVDDILEIVAVEGSSKKVRKKLHALLKVWLD